MATPTLAARLRCSHGHAISVPAAISALRLGMAIWPAIDQRQRQHRRRLYSQQIRTAFTTPTTRSEPLPEVALFTSHPPLLSPDPDHKPPDERKVKLGKTLRILQSHLPTLLQSPLPQQILSPQITLHLFPSTHPHLPTVTGRVAYIAALWSSPIAWNRVPLVGNVRLEILSERMVDGPACYASLPGGRRPEGAVGEQLVVKWRTVGGSGSKLKSWLGFDGGKGKARKTEGATTASTTGDSSTPTSTSSASATTPTPSTSTPPTDITSETSYKAPVGDALPAGTPSSKEFTGLFIFDFDAEGRILSHTIEHVQETGQWEKGVGARVVGLTDWLLGGIKGGDAPCPAFARDEESEQRWRKP